MHLRSKTSQASPAPCKLQLPVASAGLARMQILGCLVWCSCFFPVSSGPYLRPTYPTLVALEVDTPQLESASQLCDLEQVPSPL